MGWVGLTVGWDDGGFDTPLTIFVVEVKKSKTIKRMAAKSILKYKINY